MQPKTNSCIRCDNQWNQWFCGDEGTIEMSMLGGTTQNDTMGVKSSTPLWKRWSLYRGRNFGPKCSDHYWSASSCCSIETKTCYRQQTVAQGCVIAMLWVGSHSRHQDACSEAWKKSHSSPIRRTFYTTLLLLPILSQEANVVELSLMLKNKLSLGSMNQDQTTSKRGAWRWGITRWNKDMAEVDRA